MSVEDSKYIPNDSLEKTPVRRSSFNPAELLSVIYEKPPDNDIIFSRFSPLYASFFSKFLVFHLI
jgi:hypothetical protein